MSELNLDEQRIRRNEKLVILYVVFVFLLVAFIFSVLRTITSGRDIPAKTSVIHDRALRGDIVSSDGYMIAGSYKIYQATLYVKNVDPEKEELFFKLFSIYSDMNRSDIYNIFYKNDGTRNTGRVVLSRELNAKRAIQLKSLAAKLQKLKVFRATKNSNGIDVVYGLDVEEVGEARRFLLKDSLTPIIGYVKRELKDDYARPQGMKGIERYAQKYLIAREDGLFRGDRDVVSSIIRNGNSQKVERVDGLELHLNIVLSLQKRMETILDEMKEETGAEEIIAAVMESETGKVMAMASTERFDPLNITQNDVSKLNPKFAEYPYEIGSVMKPLTLALAIDYGKVTPDTWFNTFNGYLTIGRGKVISDDDKFDRLTARDIIVHSSNVGISQISWLMSGKEFREGLLRFGLSQASGIDLSRDLPGLIKPVKKLENKTHRANQSYGYGMHATFAQMIKAYAAFNNGGIAMTPRIIDFFKDAEGKQYRLPLEKPNVQAISKYTAEQMHDILTDVIKRGTGVAGQYPGLEVGGKTGTAHIATSAGYSRQYHSSFFGFANDKFGHKYTMGVLVIKANKPYKYFAAQSAVPTFRKIVNALVDLDYLQPKLTAEEIAQEQERLQKEEKQYSDSLPDYNSDTTQATKPQKKSKQKYKESQQRVTKPYIQPTKQPQQSSKKGSEELFNDLDMF